MNASRRRIIATLVLVLMMIFAIDCAREQTLTAIQIKPLGATFGTIDPSLVINFTASGTYDHPPQTKDITNLVTWHSDTPQVVQINGSGAASPSTGCGTSNVFATMRDHASGSDVTSNSAAVVVNGPASLGCTPSGAQAVLTVNLVGSGKGNVTSVPTGINCSAQTCSASFTVGTTVVLDANPQGTSTFGGWNGCSSSSGPSCTVVVQNAITVTATFN